MPMQGASILISRERQLITLQRCHAWPDQTSNDEADQNVTIRLPWFAIGLDANGELRSELKIIFMRDIMKNSV